MRRLVICTLAAVTLAGCGGDEPTQDDVAAVKQLLSSTANVQQAMQPLYLCLPDDKRCYEKDGPQVVQVVERERQGFEQALAETDNACISEAGRLYRSSLDGYATAGRAAARGNAAAFEKAISRTTRDEIAYIRKLNDCGFTEGRVAELGAAVREVNVEVLRIGEEFNTCGDESCLLDLAGRMEKQAHKGVALLDEYRSELGSDLPACLGDAIGTQRGSFVALEATAIAIQREDLEVAEREGTRAGELEIEAQRKLAACLESLGA